ncbi:Protein MAIN-LIKE 1 [Glycine max]|nr:Protein MAIN-LIKE 1 [Glycine max]
MRDRLDDHDAVDVPERRRPIASARRQRVHQMTQDVPDMTEDVPDMAEDAPEMTGDVQGDDGVEGSHVDDAEGFPGGPRDPSVLTSFPGGVTRRLEWTGLVGATGLSPLIGCSVVTGDPGLISAFVERWHNETSTLHLPVGQLTITLDDVSSLLHLPITGALHSFHALFADEVIFLLTKLLEVSAEEARAETARSRGAYERLGWVRDIYEMRCQVRWWIVAARAYLLHQFGCTLFANKSATYVHVVHLDAFRDLGQSGGYAWGVAALCWIYEHFPSVHQCVTDDAYQETSPCASWWLTSKAHMKGITGAPYRARCDALTVTDVCWLPYTEHRGVRAFKLISSFKASLCCLWMYFADHVLAVGELCLVPGQVYEDYME